MKTSRKWRPPGTGIGTLMAREGTDVAITSLLRCSTLRDMRIISVED